MMKIFRKHITREKPLRGQEGFTLPEALVTALIFSIILGASTVLLLSGMDSWQVNEVKIELQQELRKSMDWIIKDLHQAGSASITDVPADGNVYTDINFSIASGVTAGTVVWSANIQYQLGGANGDQLLRNARLIAQNIQTLEFQRQTTSPSLVEVALQAQKNSPRGHPMTDTLSFQVRLRN